MSRDYSHLLAARWGSGGGPTIIRFELTEAPVEGEGCPALIVVYGWNIDGDPQPVMEYHSLEFSEIEVWWMGTPGGALGDQGYAIWWPDAQRFEVIGMTGTSVRKAKLTESLTYAGLSAEGVYWDGETGAEVAGDVVEIFRPWTMRVDDDPFPPGTIFVVCQMDGQTVALTVACPESGAP